MPIDPMTVALSERRYVSVRSRPTLGILVHISGVPADVDSNMVIVTMVNEASEEVFSRAADHVAEGVYEITLSTTETAATGLCILYWDYSISTENQTEQTYIEIGPSSPTYDSIPQEFRDAVEAVWIKFADLFDSPFGGPHLQTYMQTNFGRERLAQLLRSSMGRLNVIAQPHMTYTIDGVGGKIFPLAQRGGLLEQMTYVEVLKHLRRSYIEQPMVNNVSVATLDRRDYTSRWGDILADEVADLETMVDLFKMSHMGLGNVHVLVSGGVYGSYAPTRVAGSVSARPRYWARFY